MSAGNMDQAPYLPPSPSPPHPDDCWVDHTRTVKTYVILAVMAMFILHVLGSLRRQSSKGLLHSSVMGVYTVSYPLVGYALGYMISSNWYYPDFTVWAVFMLLLLGSTDSLTACRLSDIDNWKSTHVKNIIKGFFMVFIVLTYGAALKRDDKEQQTQVWHHLWPPLSAVILVVVLKLYVRIASMRMVSKSYIGKNMKVIAEYMQHKDNQLAAFDPVTMKGYCYLVAGEKYCIERPRSWYKKKKDNSLKVTTVEDIWKCTGNLLIIERKDLCLSMALSKMLNRRFADFKLSEAGLEKTHDFVFKGLLVGDKPYQRAFRVIEEELVFVHDMYYTRYSYLYHKGRYWALCLPVIMIALCSWLTVTCLWISKNSHPRVLDPNTKTPSLKPLTIFITVVLAGLEAYQLYLYMASGWFKVAMIRSYVNAPCLQRSCCSEKIIDLLLRLKAFRPWKGRLGQYCLMQDFAHKNRVRNCLHYATVRLVDKAKKGRPKHKLLELSEDVKKSIVDFLVGSNGHLTNGVTSLQNNGVHGHLSWACDATATDGTVTRTILIWHIATTLCEHQLEEDEQAKEAEEAVKTASTLSQYCMHLIAFAPNLLPDHSSMSESILDQSIEEAGKLLDELAKDKKMATCSCFIKRKKLLATRCKMLMDYASSSNLDSCVGDEERLVAQGVQLYKLLTNQIEKPALRWKVLSDFWVEMMLYVSPSDNARAHLELLAKGGEFITHLWALLTHAGVLKRGHTGPYDAV